MRRVTLWLSIISFTLVAVSNLSVFIIRRMVTTRGGANSWGFYTPYSTMASPWLAAHDVLMLISTVMLPVGLISASVYMFLVERRLHQLSAGGGFDVVGRP